MSFADEPILIFDGACGTTLQSMELSESLWKGKEGCNEYLNLTSPETIVRLHDNFLQAGAMVLETNTFGASSLVLAEYGLEDQVEQINVAAVAHARTAIGSRSNCYVAGSVGPTTKLPSLGHVSVDELYESLCEQMSALLCAGVDVLIIETCQDLLQVKTALVACFDLMEEAGREVPVMVSVTIEQQGTMLVGSDIAAVVATLEPFPIFSLGLNCATGPTDMESHIRYLSKNWPQRISCVPNQGLPEIVDGQTRYPLQAEEFAELMKRFVEEQGVSVVGGCCGSSPAHIQALVMALDGVIPKQREVR
ncbi:MAG TPA: homocysteine S-methyltransferase family protein [Geopsychrobacteraceae bacterium]|nr:homocysteine S-methyltransferase family protein [Geopsychrobacteraceae bacterium]